MFQQSQDADQQPQSILVMPLPPPSYDETVQGTPHAIVPVTDEKAREVDALSGHPNVPGQNNGEAVVPHEPIYVPETYNYAYYATPFTTHGHVIHKAWTTDGSRRKVNRFFNWCIFLVALAVLTCCIIFLVRLTNIERRMQKRN